MDLMAKATAKRAAEAAEGAGDGASPALADPHLSAWAEVVRAHAAVTERLQEALTESGMPPLSWYEVLDALANAPELRLRMGELADELIITRGGLTKLLDRLVKAGLVERATCDSDRRVAYAVLSEAGEAMHEEMKPVVMTGLRSMFIERTTGEEARSIAEALSRVTSAACAGE